MIRNHLPTAPHRQVLALAIAFCLAGCQSTQPRLGSIAGMEDALQAAKASHSSASQVPAAVQNALLPPIHLNMPKASAGQDTQRFDINVTNVPAPQFFMGLVDGTRYNMVVHPDVQGSISMSIKGVTIPEIMDTARDVYGYEFQRAGNSFQVMPSRLQARVYQVNYLNVNRMGTSSTFVSSGTLQSGPSARYRDDRNGDGANSGGTSSSTSSRRQNRSVIGTQISTEQPRTSFWAELQAAVESIVGNGEGRSVVVSPQSGVVVVRALPSELREVETFMRATQLIAQRQVILEAKVLEVELSDGYQQGINWAGIVGDIVLGQTGGGSVFNTPGGVSDIAGQKGNLNPSPKKFSAIDSALASAFGGVFSIAVNGSDFAAFIELLKRQGNVQVLSSPRISTMNNQKAVIKVGTDEFFVTDVSTTTVAATTAVSTPNIELTPFFSGIALDVTPQISESEDVTLHIHPSVSEVQDQKKEITVGGQTQTLPLARSTVRESDSVVRARSGQIVVIGGLMQDRLNDQRAKTPGLGEIPWFGGLFHQTRTNSTKSELVILLKPLVVEDGRQWARALDDVQQNVGRLHDELDNWKNERFIQLKP